MWFIFYFKKYTLYDSPFHHLNLKFLVWPGIFHCPKTLHKSCQARSIVWSPWFSFTELFPLAMSPADRTCSCSGNGGSLGPWVTDLTMAGKATVVFRASFSWIQAWWQYVWELDAIILGPLDCAVLSIEVNHIQRILYLSVSVFIHPRVRYLWTK